MASEFLDFLDVRQIGWQSGRPVWLTLAPLRYRSAALGTTVMIPAEFISDLASTPRLLFTWFIAGGRAPRPSVVHDYGYQCGNLPLAEGGVIEVSRAQLDSTLHEGMLADPMSGTGPVVGGLMYGAVRAGGWWPWLRRGKRARVLNPVWSTTGWPEVQTA